MSVLTSPRVYFMGTISWDPGLANNNSDLFDSQRVEVKFPAGVTQETFPDYLIDNLARFGIWNLYGTHDAKLEHYATGPNANNDSRIVGGKFRPGSQLVESDALFGTPVTLRGKLVDLDPEAVWNSQIFFDRFSMGDGTVGFTAKRFKTMHSRWINFRRNLDRLDIAGAAGVVWQTVFPRDHVQFRGEDRSPLLQGLKAASEAQGADGIMLRFATYRTLYFQNGILNQQPYRPRDGQELQRLHKAGDLFTNPAYSRVVGSVGIWNSGEPTSWPGGRFLVPSGAAAPVSVGGSPISLGPAVAEVDERSSRLILDFLHVVPELNRSLDKPDLGNLFVSVRVDDELVELGSISPVQYGRSSYEREAGMIEIPLSLTAWLSDRLQRGQLEVHGEVRGQRVPLLVEEPRIVVAEIRDNYASLGASKSVQVKVYNRGQMASQALRVFVGKYIGLTRTNEPAMSFDVKADGTSEISFPTSEPGTADFGLAASSVSGDVPQLATQLDITAGQFFSTRILPTDETLESQTTDDQLTWEFIYTNILRNWDLLNPIMSLRGLPLSDEQAVKDAAERIREVINPDHHESIEYMPITRDLSPGKRRLLERWIDLQQT